MTGETDHPLFWNKKFQRIHPSYLSQFFWKLSQDKICKTCFKRFSEYDLKEHICEKCKTPFSDKEWIILDFHIHLDRGAGASDLLDLGVPVSDVAKYGGWDSSQTVSKHYDASDEKKARERVREVKEGISKCPSCKKRIEIEATFCPFCAYKLIMSP
jgi:predicted amidophosphoribosyltransferase